VPWRRKADLLGTKVRDLPRELATIGLTHSHTFSNPLLRKGRTNNRSRLSRNR